jgi:hypothetical protein
MLEINDIKESIKKEKELTVQMEAERNNLLIKNNTKSKTKKQTDEDKDGELTKMPLEQLAI